MSADTAPISPERFAAALKDLSPGMLHLKVLEIRNSIAHLQYSNDQLRPFADGSTTAMSEEGAEGGRPDPDCVEAIRENELVIDRMAERIALVRAEVEDRGASWTEFQSKEEVEAAQGEAATAAAAEEETNGAVVNGQTDRHDEAPQHTAWSDGTFQTGSIRNGEVHMDAQPGQRPTGGRLNDDELRRAMEERLRNLGVEEDEDEGDGMHL